MPQALLSIHNTIWRSSYRSTTWCYVFKSWGLQNTIVSSLKHRNPNQVKYYQTVPIEGVAIFDSYWFEHALLKPLVLACLVYLSFDVFYKLACMYQAWLTALTATHIFNKFGKKPWWMGVLWTVWSSFAATVTQCWGCLSDRRIKPQYSVADEQKPQA